MKKIRVAVIARPVFGPAPRSRETLVESFRRTRREWINRGYTGGYSEA